MYINKIDDLIDKIIDDFNTVVISKNKEVSKIIKETNFVKYQNEINDIMENYIKTINLNQLKELVKSEDSIHSIHETIKRYIALYFFLMIGFIFFNRHILFGGNRSHLMGFIAAFIFIVVYIVHINVLMEAEAAFPLLW